MLRTGFSIEIDTATSMATLKAAVTENDEMPTLSMNVKNFSNLCECV